MNTTGRHTFGKAERLCSTRLITLVFENGNTFYSPLFRVVWIVSPSELPFPAQVAVSVPKKIFRSAVKRNLMKRRIREAYRKNKHILYDFLRDENLQIAFVIIFRAVNIADYSEVEKSVTGLINTLCSQIRETRIKS